MGFILKLWRGEVSLSTTFWIFGAVVVFMFQMLEYVPLDDPGQISFLRNISSLYYIFISIAIFRSTFRYNGSRLFIMYCQLSAVGLLMLAGFRLLAGSGVFGGIAS